MSSESSATYGSAIADPWLETEAVRRHARECSTETLAARWRYRLCLAREPIWLSPIEFRIFSFLSARPYHAFTPRRIARAITSESHPVEEEAIRRHVASLRRQLGFYSDYIQSVPYIGYRFKA